MSEPFSFDSNVVQFVLWQIGIGGAFFGGLGGWMQYLHLKRMQRQDDVEKISAMRATEVEKLISSQSNEFSQSIRDLNRDVSGIVGQVRALQQDVAKNYVSWDHLRELDRRLERRFDVIDARLSTLIDRGSGAR